jgi:hypothetical protein
MLSFLVSNAFLVGAIFFFFFHKRTKNHGRINRLSYGWVIPFALLFVAMCLFAASWPGQLIGSWTAGAIGSTATTVLIVALVIGAGIDLWDGKPDAVAKTAVIVVPLLVFYAQGPIARTVGELVHGTQNAGRSTISKMGG